MPALDDMAESRLEALDKQGLWRMPITTSPLEGMWVERGGRKLLSFSSNDYLGLSRQPDVLAAAQIALHLYGAGAGASRYVTGENPLYAELEQQLCGMKQTEATCVFSSGYMATLGGVCALMGKGDLILADKLCHACMVDAAQLSGAKFIRFAHNDMQHLEQLLTKHREQYQHCLILSETVFSMDGDCAPLEAISELAKAHDAWVLSDDAHGLGVVESYPVDIQIGTLSKAAGSLGGYVCASRAVIDLIKNTARNAIYTTALPPATLAASLAALRIMVAQSDLGAKALGYAQQFSHAVGLADAQSAIVPLIIGEAEAALQASQTLAEAGYLVSAIRPPTVPQGTARLRFTFSALHTEEEVDALITEVRRHGWH